MSSKTGFGIHDDGRTTVVAEVRPMRGSWRIEGLKRTSAVHGPEPETVARLRRGGHPLVLTLPEDAVHHAVVAMPPMRGGALDRALAGSIARDHGGEPREWCLAHRRIGAPEQTRDGSRHKHFLLYARTADVRARTGPLAARGVWATGVMPAFLVLDQFFRAHGPREADLEAWNLVFVGREEHFLVIGTGEVPLLVRQLPGDLSGGADRDEYVGRLATEVERSLHFARQIEPPPNIGRVVVCGEPDLAADLTARLAGETEAEVLHWDAAAAFTWGPHEQRADDLIPLMAAVLGLGRLEYDLVGGRGLLRLGAEGRRRLREVAVVAATVALPLLIGGGMVTARVQRGYLDEARARLDESLARARAAESVYHSRKVVLAREDRIAEATGDRPDLEAVLLHLADLAPAPVTFQGMEIRERSRSHFLLRLEGESAAPTAAAAQAAFLDFLDRLDGADFLLRRSEPQVLRLLPGEGRRKGAKTSLFRMDLILKRTDRPDDPAPARTPGEAT